MTQPPSRPGTSRSGAPDPADGDAGPDGSEATARDRFRDWPAPFRHAVYALVIVLVLVVIAVFAGAVVVRRPLPQTTGQLSIDGLSGDVQVLRDGHGVPQIYADDSIDLFTAQGYVQAQDRFWQMDYRRHAASGRLSELFGSRTLERDELARTLGWHRVAEDELPLLSADTRRALEAFSTGVNDWLATHSGSRTSLEYTLLSLSTDYRPAPWTPVDSLDWFKAMAWNLSGNIEDEVARARLSVDRDPAQVAALYPPYPTRAHPPIVQSSAPARPAVTSRASNPPPITPARLAPIERAGSAAERAPALLGTGDGIGSNSWVVSGALTTSGMPLLANDPHLDATAPGVLYQMGLHCRVVGDACPYDVSGFTYAGFPGVVIGHNRKVAWGMSSLHADTTDLYLEKILGTTYRYRGRQLPLRERDERIRVTGGSTKVITVRSTRPGPLLSDVSPELSSTGANAPVPLGAPDRGNGYAVAVDWQGLTPSRSADAVLGLDRATDWRSFRAAASLLDAPAENLVYADTAGHIGYQATGAIPVRRPGETGRYPVAGWVGRQDQTARTLPFAELPSELDPESGVIVAANQEPVPGGSPHLADTFDYGYRSDRIGDLLDRRVEVGSKLRVADMTAIQDDTRNPIAPALVPYLLDVPLPSAYDAGGQRLLAHWNYTQPAGSAAAAYFNAVWRNLLALTFHDQLRTSLWPDGGSRWMVVVSKLLRQPDSPWWDDVDTDDVVENRDTILARAMEDARDELVRRQARDPAKWTWGHLHRLDLDRPGFTDTGRIARALFDRNGRGTGGGAGAVDATSWDARDDYTVTQAPAMRMVVDLGDLDRSRWVDLAGASGHAFGPHYLDQLGLWLRGGTTSWPSTPAAVRSRTVDTLRLTPSG